MRTSLVALVAGLVSLPVSAGTAAPARVRADQVSISRDDLRRSTEEALRRSAERWFRHGDMVFETQNDARAALNAFRQALEAARQLGDGALLAQALWRVASVYAVSLSEPEKRIGVKFAEEAIAAARAVGDRRNEAWALLQMGDACYGLGDYPRALESFRAALHLMREAGDRSGEAIALKNVGITDRQFGRFDETLEYLQEAADIFREVGWHAQAVSALQNLGTAYANVGAYGRALDAYEQASLIARAHPNPQHDLHTFTRMGFLYLDVNDAQQAFDQFRQARAIARTHGLGDGWSQTGLAAALFFLGEVDRAIGTSQEALREASQRKDRQGVAGNLWDLAEQHMDRDPAAALHYLQEAFAIFGPYDRRVDLHRWGIYHSFARAYRRLGDLDQAIAYSYRAVEGLEGLKNQIASAELKSTFVAKHQRVYQELMEALLERSRRDPGGRDAARAYEILERARARAMVEAIAESRLELQPARQPEVRKREQQLGDRLARLQRSLVQNDLPAQERQRITAELARTEQEFDRFLVELRRQAPQYAARRYPEPLSLPRAQALLDGRTALVAYSLGPEALLAFVVTARGFHVERLAVSPGLLAQRVQTYVDLLGRSVGTGWEGISRRLYADLFAPLREHLPRSIDRLIIIADGILHYLPFETLMEGDRQPERRAQVVPDIDRPTSGPRYLLEDYSISYIPSATLLAELKAFESTSGSAERRDLYVVADPVLPLAGGPELDRRRIAAQTRALYDDEGLPVTPIPYSASEAQTIAKYARNRSAVFLGPEASERRVKADRLDGFRVVHFATHALISERAPARSALVLATGDGDAEDGFLQAREIYQLKLNSDLVVLSACRTARGRVLVGEGVQGLVQAFLYAGARSVVVSLWNVNDERTATFMAAFYRHLAAGRSKADALRAAKLDLLREDATAAPRYWAPFVLIGEPHQPVPLSGAPWWTRALDGRLLVLLPVILLVVAVTAAKLRRVRR